MGSRFSYWLSCALLFSLAGILTRCGAAGTGNAGGQTPSISVSAVNPPSVTLFQGGGSQTITVALARTNYTGSVSLSLSALPSGVTSNITQPGTSNSGSVTLQAASNAALVNNQVITITGSGSGVADATASFSLSVTPPPSGTISEQIVVVGQTDSANFPANSAAFPSYAGGSDGFVSSVRLTTTSGSTASQTTFSTYFGGTNLDQVRDTFLDPQGNIYVTGRTASIDLPTTAGVFQPNYRGGPQDAFVAKFSPSGQLIFSTYLGGGQGGGYDVGYSMYVDSTGFIYVSGRTSSTDFPVTSGAFQTTYAGGQNIAPYFGGDIFVTKMKPDGSGIVWSTYVGGSGDDLGRGRLFVDSSGAVYAEGVTASADFPTKQAFQAMLKGAEDGVVFKLAPDGKSLIYSTFLGGTDTRGDAATGGLVVNAAGEAFVCGFTTAPDFPTTVGGFQRTLSGIQDAFLVRLAANGSSLLASTLLGGTGDEACHGLALDSAGNPIILGTTTSSDFPTTASAYQRVLRGPTDFTITKMPPNLSSLIFSTYVGGSGREDADTAGIVLDANDNIYFTAGTDSIDFPVTSNAIQASYGGGTHDVCVVKLSATGAQILYATYLGGSGDDFARSIRYKKN